MNRNRVLVVDDDLICLEVTKERLERAGYDVVTFDRALGTSKVIHDIEPEVVLLDVMMPGLSGHRLVELLLRHPRFRALGIFLHSSKRGEELLELVHECGAHGAIEKTHDEHMFLARFEHLLGRLRDRSASFRRSAT